VWSLSVVTLSEKRQDGHAQVLSQQQFILQEGGVAEDSQRCTPQGPVGPNSRNPEGVLLQAQEGVRVV